MLKKTVDPWAKINWQWEIPPDANPHDIVEAKVRILSNRMPEKYKQILRLLADACSPNLISALTGIDIEVIRRIKQLQPVTISRIKEVVLDNLLEASQVMSERLAVEAPTLPADKLANALSSTIDKVQLLSGGVTQRTETKRVVSREELQALFEALPRAQATLIPEEQPDAD